MRTNCMVLQIQIGVQYCERDGSNYNCRFLLSVTDPKPFNWLFCRLFWTVDFGNNAINMGGKIAFKKW